MWSFLQNLIVAIVGAGIGVWSAFSLFYRQIKNQRNEELLKSLDKRKGELVYFASMVKNIIAVSEAQIKFLNEYTEKIQLDKVNFHLLKQTPIDYLNRIISTEKLQDYLLAYTEHFDNDTNSIKQFNQIIAIIDYLNASFQSIREQVYKSQQFDFQRKKMFQSNFKKAYLYAEIVTIKQDIETRDLRNKIIARIKDFNRLQKGLSNDLNFFNNHFLEPIRSVILQYYLTVDVPKDYIPKLNYFIIDSQQTLSFIKLENQRLMSDIKEQTDTIANEFKNLKDYSADLLDEVL